MVFNNWLISGLLVTLKKFFSKKITQLYPEVYPDLAPRVRGSFVFAFEKCTSCTLCVLACPNQVIKLDVQKDEQGKRKLACYNMSLSYCLYCGLCVEACPTSAIQMQPNFENSGYHKTSTIKKWEAV